MKPVRKAFLALLLALVCLTPHGYAQDTASHPVDGRMQRLSVLSQRDEAIGELRRQAGGLCVPPPSA